MKKNKKIQIIETIVFGYHRNNVASSKTIKRFSTKEHRHHTRTINKRDIGRLFRLSANDVNEVRIAKAEHEGKTPLVWCEFGYWHLRRRRERRTYRLKFCEEPCWVLKRFMPMFNKKRRELWNTAI